MLIDWIALALVRVVFGLLRLVPTQVGIKLISGLFRIVFFCSPELRAVIEQNLLIAFPQSDAKWRSAIKKASCHNYARLLLDFARLDQLSPQWIESHVDFPDLAAVLELKKRYAGKALLYASGHLSSFELLARSLAHYLRPFSFVVRDFKLPGLDNWWRSKRQACGNKVISRRGAFKAILRDLIDGQDVAVLFDQNITRKHAVFVDFFGKKAATTRALALVAIRMESPVVVTCISYKGADRYQIKLVPCDFMQIYADSQLDMEQKVFQITSIISKHLEQMIKESPAEWFWMHRRWKTQERDQDEVIYA